MVKLHEIAKLTGVSVSTVSRIINNKGNFSEETRQKVLQAIDGLMYKPMNVLDKISNNSYTIGVYIPSTDSFINNKPSLSMDLNSLQQEIESTGNILILTTNPEKLDKTSLSYKLIEERKMDAAIVFDPFLEDETIEQLTLAQIPYIVTNGRSPDLDWNYIDYDNKKGASDVIDYLYSLGHRKIAILGGPERHLVSINRMEGCKASFKKHNLEFDKSKVFHGSFSFDNGYNSAKEMIMKCKDITAVFAFDDIIACGAMRAINEAGLKISDDISVVGFDDIELSKFVAPQLTTVRRSDRAINQIIAKLINYLITNKSIDKIQISLKTELIIRDSCKNIAL